MYQFFNNKRFLSSFEENTIPKLLFICKSEGNHAQMPRTMHMHNNQTEIVFIRNGSGLYTIGGEQYKTHKGDILLYNSGVTHDESISNSDEDVCVYCCGISGLQLKHLTLNCFIANNIQPVIPAGVHFDQIVNLFEMLYNCTLDSTFNTAEITNYLLRALIVTIRSIIEKSSQSLELNGKNIAVRIKKYIDVHCLEDINLYTVSTELNISQYYLCHIFKENFGYSPIQYVIRRRIGEAQSFLINTDYSVTRIATMVGFNNSNYFHTIFLKMIGMPPLQYRKYWVEEQRNKINGK